MSATVCRPSGDLVVKVPASGRVDDDPLSSTRSSHASRSRPTR